MYKSTGIIIEPTTAELSNYDGNSIKVLGKCNLNVEMGKSNKNQKNFEFYIINTQVDKKVAILGLEDIVKLGIVKRFIEIEENYENVNITKEFNHVFDEVGCIEGNYEIKLKDNLNSLCNKKKSIFIGRAVEKRIKKLCDLQIIKKCREIHWMDAAYCYS